MRQIKFRGRNRVTDEFVYGTYYYEHFKDTPKEIHAIISEYGEEWRIDPESLAQLVGIDSNGKEVYEGDTVVDQYGNEHTAYLVGILDGETEFIRLDDEIDTATIEFKLKDE